MDFLNWENVNPYEELKLPQSKAHVHTGVSQALTQHAYHSC